jgi:hypothetical protein
MIFTKDENGNAVSNYHGVPVIGIVNKINFGESTVECLTSNNAGKVIISIGITFTSDGETIDTGLSMAVSKENFPNTALYSDDTKTEWNPELKEWFVNELVGLTL